MKQYLTEKATWQIVPLNYYYIILLTKIMSSNRFAGKKFNISVDLLIYIKLYKNICKFDLDWLILNSNKNNWITKKQNMVL